MRSTRHRDKLIGMSFNTLIDVAGLRELQGDVLLLDCRFDLADPRAGRREYLRARIPGARYADLNLDLSAPVTPTSGRHPLPDPATLAEFLGTPAQVVAYDAGNGGVAARAWWLCQWLGVTPCAVLDGGFAAWVAAGGAVESGEPAVSPKSAAGVPAVSISADSVVTATDVLRALADPDRLLIDARAAERFSGRVEPLDPVAGHVPGAINHPFTGNLTATGHFLPVEELRRLWLARLSGRPPGNVIAMCGSGVTACHNLLALAHAGLAGAKLYAGSWSEWIRDPDRPVA